jgi:hypothetical protein
MEKIIEIAVALTLIASATGNLHKIIRRVQLAEVKLIQESKTSTWGHLMIVGESRNSRKDILPGSR